MDPATAMAIAKGAEKAVGGISTLMEFVDTCKDRSIVSLSEYTKSTIITSRAYVEDVIGAEPLTHELLKLLNQIYGAMVISTLNLNEVITEGRCVKDLIAPVSTESFEVILDTIESEFGVKPEVKDLGALEDMVPGSIGAKEVKTAVDSASLFTGRLVEVTLGRGDQKATLYFLVQLCPYILPSEVLTEFLRLNTDPSKTIRKAQWKAGEIKFWRDYFFEADRIARRKKALRMDKDGILREVESHRTGGLWQSICNWLKPKNAVNRNIANTIVVVSKSSLDKVTKELGLNIRNFRDRQNLMSNTLTLMLVVYDPNYETVDLYMHGIANRGEYTAQTIKSATKKNDDIDIKQLLTLISAGNAPKF